MNSVRRCKLTNEVTAMNCELWEFIYSLTLTASDGTKQRMAAYLPSEASKQNVIAAAHERGLQIELEKVKKD